MSQIVLTCASYGVGSILNRTSPAFSGVFAVTGISITSPATLGTIETALRTTIVEPCGAAQPICNVVAGRCVQCLADGDCPAGYLCDDNDECHQGCKTNADCGGDRPLCDTATGACLGCMTATDCGATAPICTTAGICVQCQVNTDCKQATFPFCNGDRCVQCIGNEGCVAGQKCHGGVCG